jgi:hypothetical protein
MIRILNDAIHRTNLDALLLVEVPHAFGAFRRVDDEDVLPLRDGFVGAFRYAHIAVDALFGDD